MLEPANTMFEMVRDCSWLDTIDILLDIMTTRIAKLRKIKMEKVE